MITKRCSQFSLLVVSGLSLCGAFSLAVPPTGELVVKGTSVQAPLALGALSVIHNKDGFSVVKDGATSSVQTHCLDKSLRGISQSNLKSLLDSNGYLRVTQAGNGEYLLDAQGRVQGGGPILGTAVYWAIKGLGYGTVGLVSLGVAAVVGAGEQKKKPGLVGAQDTLKVASVGGSATLAFLAKLGVFGGIESAAWSAGVACGMAPTL